MADPVPGAICTKAKCNKSAFTCSWRNSFAKLGGGGAARPSPIAPPTLAPLQVNKAPTPAMAARCCGPRLQAVNRGNAFAEPYLERLATPQRFLLLHELLLFNDEARGWLFAKTTAQSYTSRAAAHNIVSTRRHVWTPPARRSPARAIFNSSSPSSASAMVSYRKAKRMAAMPTFYDLSWRGEVGESPRPPRGTQEIPGRCPGRKLKPLAWRRLEASAMSHGAWPRSRPRTTAANPPATHTLLSEVPRSEEAASRHCRPPIEERPNTAEDERDDVGERHALTDRRQACLHGAQQKGGALAKGSPATPSEPTNKEPI